MEKSAKPVTLAGDIAATAALAAAIWREHYPQIIGEEQVEYMVEKFQSVSAMESQLTEGYLYFQILGDGVLRGYFSVQTRGDSLFLSKIYVEKAARGLGLGRFGMEQIEALAREKNLSSISLTVNKHNSNTIAAYENMGFSKIEPIVIDIGNGFVMDDWKMVKTLPETP